MTEGGTLLRTPRTMVRCTACGVRANIAPCSTRVSGPRQAGWASALYASGCRPQSAPSSPPLPGMAAACPTYPTYATYPAESRIKLMYRPHRAAARRTRGQRRLPRRLPAAGDGGLPHPRGPAAELRGQGLRAAGLRRRAHGHAQLGGRGARRGRAGDGGGGADGGHRRLPAEPPAHGAGRHRIVRLRLPRHDPRHRGRDLRRRGGSRARRPDRGRDGPLVRWLPHRRHRPRAVRLHGALPGDRLRRADGGHEAPAAGHGVGRPRARPRACRPISSV